MLINKKDHKGFTIIEVMIVLAIAGLIMLIVFLAVPALQRNSRNTALRNDVASVLGGVSEFITNNNGSLPTTITTSGTDVTIHSTVAGTSDVTAKVKDGTAVSNGTAMPTCPAGGTCQTGTIVVYLNRKCTNNAFSATATPRAVAAGYLVEGANGNTTNQCTES